MLRLLVALFVSITANLVLRTATRLLVAVVASVEAVALVTVVVVAEVAASVTVGDEEDVAAAVVSAIVAVEEVVELLPTVEALVTSPARRRHSKASKATLSRTLFYDTLYH